MDKQHIGQAVGEEVGTLYTGRGLGAGGGGGGAGKERNRNHSMSSRSLVTVRTDDATCGDEDNAKIGIVPLVL